MMKVLYYIGFCLIVINAGAIIMNLIFANEFSWSLIDRHVGFLTLGVFEMLYARLKFYYNVQKDDFFVTILAIENVCDEESASKIRKAASDLYFFMKINPTEFWKTVDKEALEKANKGGKQ